MKTDGLYLQYAPDALKSDNVIVGFAVKQNAKALQYASSGFVLAAVKTGGIYVQYAPEALKSNNVIVGFAVKQKRQSVAIRFQRLRPGSGEDGRPLSAIRS